MFFAFLYFHFSSHLKNPRTGNFYHFNNSNNSVVIIFPFVWLFYSVCLCLCACVCFRLFASSYILFWFEYLGFSFISIFFWNLLEENIIILNSSNDFFFTLSIQFWNSIRPISFSSRICVFSYGVVCVCEYFKIYNFLYVCVCVYCVHNAALFNVQNGVLFVRLCVCVSACDWAVCFPFLFFFINLYWTFAEFAHIFFSFNS